MTSCRKYLNINELHFICRRRRNRRRNCFPPIHPPVTHQRRQDTDAASLETNGRNIQWKHRASFRPCVRALHEQLQVHSRDPRVRRQGRLRLPRMGLPVVQEQAAIISLSRRCGGTCNGRTFIATLWHGVRLYKRYYFSFLPQDQNVAVEPLYIEFIKAREADILSRITTRQLFFPQNWTVGTLSQTQKAQWYFSSANVRGSFTWQPFIEQFKTIEIELYLLLKKTLLSSFLISNRNMYIIVFLLLFRNLNI